MVNVQNTYKLPFHKEKIFEIETESQFNQLAMAIFHFQYHANPIYRQYCDYLNVNPKGIINHLQIPFLPIEAFKNHAVKSFKTAPEIVFTSSGTSGNQTSKHFVKDVALYEQSFTLGFERAYGPIEDYLVIGLLPSYLEREGSSLVYMVESFIQKSRNSESGFFLNNYAELLKLTEDHRDKKILIIGVSYALLDLGEQFNPDLSHCMIMETGGMKGKRKELIKAELHQQLKKLLNVDVIHSEYGMTELMSQAYSKGLAFKCPPWMKVLTREYNDPFSLITNKTGGVNIIDLANVDSCSFIATDDLGKVFSNHFEIMGRYDNTDLRGCNLLVQ